MTSSLRVENVPAPPEGAPSFDEFLRAVYPPPAEGDSLRSFYEQWGYEQFLIKTQKHDVEQLRILLDADYNMVLLAAIGTPLEIAEWARESRCPLVVAEEDWTGFVWRKVVKGLVGVAMWECADGDLFCVFPKLATSPLAQPYAGPVRREQVSFLGTGVVYESDEEVIRLSLERMEGGD